MKITYISHSGFLVEWENCYWLFDYYKGGIPVMDSGKQLIVFVSHKHGDHFNPEIFELSNKYKNISYILSSDIKLKDNKNNPLELNPNLPEKVHIIKPNSKLEFSDQYNKAIIVETLKSTDCGVAFLLHYQGKTIYYAGDLNLWMWKGESRQYNNNMKAMFDKEMQKLKDITIDIAFAPLDPRQEEYYYMGLVELLETARVKYVFPMHCWGEFDIIKQFRKEWPMYCNASIIMDVDRDGQQWGLDI